MVILKVIFYIVLTIYILGLLGKLAMRYLLYKARKDMEQGGNGTFFRSYGWGASAPQEPPRKAEGEVKIKSTPQSGGNKKIKKDVGDYVDYEEIKD